MSAGTPGVAWYARLFQYDAWANGETLSSLRSGNPPAKALRWMAHIIGSGELWLASKEPALRLLAAHALSRSSIAKLALPSLKKQLADRLPHIRVWTLFAIETVLGRRVPPSEYDPLR